MPGRDWDLCVCLRKALGGQAHHFVSGLHPGWSTSRRVQSASWRSALINMRYAIRRLPGTRLLCRAFGEHAVGGGMPHCMSAGKGALPGERMSCTDPAPVLQWVFRAPCTDTFVVISVIL